MRQTPLRRKKGLKTRKPLRARASLARNKPIAKKRRSTSDFRRVYGSRERVAFIKSLPCIACGKAGHSDNAHVQNGGMARKADASLIVPLCSHRSEHGEYGCHRRLHNLGVRTFEQRHGLDLRAEAARVDALWQSRAGLVRELEQQRANDAEVGR